MKTQYSVDELRGCAHKAIEQFDHYVIGMPQIGRRMTMGIIKGDINHFLAIGMPGVAKTRATMVFALTIGGRQYLIQGTPDKMPKDVTGSEFFDKKSNDWRIRWTKLVRANIIMVDEVNRLDTRTQSALFSPMSEAKVTIDVNDDQDDDAVARGTRSLHPVNMFLCTMNPQDQDGVNPIPEAQKDRFLFWEEFNYPERAAEIFLMKNRHLARRAILNEIKPVFTLDMIEDCREHVLEKIRVSDTFIDYYATILRATRPGSEEFVQLWNRHEQIRPILDAVKFGISPRANLALLEACQTRAFLFGKDEDNVKSRDFVMPVDLKELAHPAMRGRIIMKEEAALHRVKGDVSTERTVEKPVSGLVTREEVYAKLNRPGLNPITADDLINALLTHIDFTTEGLRLDLNKHDQFRN